MDIIKLNYHEQRALLDYLKQHLLKEEYEDENLDSIYLLTAYNKLQYAIDKRDFEIACMD